MEKITNYRKEVGNMRYDDAPAEGGEGGGSSEPATPPDSDTPST